MLPSIRFHHEANEGHVVAPPYATNTRIYEYEPADDARNAIWRCRNGDLRKVGVWWVDREIRVLCFFPASSVSEFSV